MGRDDQVTLQKRHWSRAPRRSGRRDRRRYTLLIRLSDHLEFRALNSLRGHYEPAFHSFVCWGGNGRGGFNIGVGMALPCRSSQRGNWRGLRDHSGKGAVDFTAPLHSSRRWGWLPHRMVPAVLARRVPVTGRFNPLSIWIKKRLRLGGRRPEAVTPPLPVRSLKVMPETAAFARRSWS
jgi:hypothetical protein